MATTVEISSTFYEVLVDNIPLDMKRKMKYSKTKEGIEIVVQYFMLESDHNEDEEYYTDQTEMLLDYFGEEVFLQVNCEKPHIKEMGMYKITKITYVNEIDAANAVEVTFTKNNH